ncbi:MAG: hypothetical protein EOO38_27090, partial [Cytophagaceae bacterium]
MKLASHKLPAAVGSLLVSALIPLALQAQPTTISPTEQEKAPSFFENPIEQNNLELTAALQWVDGKKQPLPSTWNRGAASVLWTKDSGPDLYGQNFGDSKTPGARSVTFGFKKPIKAASF